MVLFDSTFLILLLQPNSSPAKDRENKIVPDGPQRIEQLLRVLSNDNTVVCVPTPVIAEVMALGGKGGSSYLNEMKKSSRFYLAPFDTPCAVEAWELIALMKKQNPEQKWSMWAKVKFDCQIAATAKCHGITRIYSDDKDIFEHGRRLGISVLRVCDLAPAPKLPEGVLEFTHPKLDLRDPE